MSRNLCVSQRIKSARLAAFALLVGLALLALPGVWAERLPIKNYSIADGLASDRVLRIRRDSRGFLWFCTSEGLSRFDGYRFTTYTTADGLPPGAVRDLLETRSGVYLVSTDNGVCLFNPYGVSAREKRKPELAEPLFTVFRPTATRHFYSLHEDRAGNIWCGTNIGLFRLELRGQQVEFHYTDLGMPNETIDDRDVRAMLEDRRGSLWVGTGGSGVYRRLPDGRVERYTVKHGLPGNGAYAMLEDREGRLWMGSGGGLWQVVPDPKPDQPLVARLYRKKDGLPADWVTTLFHTSDGRIWVGTVDGFSEFAPDGNLQSFRNYNSTHGMVDNDIRSLAEDRDGNLWIGTKAGGASKLARNGFTIFGKDEGIKSGSSVKAIFEDQSGAVCLIDGSSSNLVRFDGQKWTTIRPNYPRRIRYFGWGWSQIAFQSRDEEWWLPTGQGLCRFPKVKRFEDLAHTPPKAVYTTRDGLISDDIFRLYEDSRGDVWITPIHPGKQGLSRWERATERFHHYQPGAGELPSGNVESFAEDESGNLWLGTFDGLLARYRLGQFKTFTSAEGLPEAPIRGLHFDHSGRLWLASDGGGVVRIDDPNADRLRFITYTTADGLSTDTTSSITHDQQGRIYIGNFRGVDRLDPATGQVRQYTTADGLGRGGLNAVFRDRHGALWFAALLGLSRLIPESDRPESPPPVMVNGVRISGIAQHVSELGETTVGQLELNASQNNVSIDFFALGFGLGEVLRYQYKLEGADRDWSAPSESRTVNYASLSPGSYRFLVRAISSNGSMSAQPAAVSFKILRPVWQRWWFVTLAALAVGLTAFAFYRSRVKRIVELERMPTRIATDLHDDIGSSLSQIAILSEVSRRRVGHEQNGVGESLAQIANTSRDLVDSMSDIVWAINPRRDRLSDLTHRMREFAGDVFTAREIEFSFRAPSDGQEIRLDADVRRRLYLIFKEAVNNAARHAQCTEAEIEFEVAQDRLLLHVRDNGRGFDPNGGDAASRNGNGLVSMRERAQALGGEIEITSQPNLGTVVKLNLPLNPSRWRR